MIDDIGRGDIVRHKHGNVDGIVVEYGWDRYLEVVVDWGCRGDGILIPTEELVVLKKHVKD